MHEIGFEHLHVTPEEEAALAQSIWEQDNVELTTVGVDVGHDRVELPIAQSTFDSSKCAIQQFYKRQLGARSTYSFYTRIGIYDPCYKSYSYDYSQYTQFIHYLLIW